MTGQLERYVTATELAQHLGVSTSTVKRWVSDGCPSETWGMRVRRFRVSDVMKWRRETDTLVAPPAALERQRLDRSTRR